MAKVALFVFFVLIVGDASLVRGACRVAPEFWCDDLSIASECGVKDQCESFAKSNAKLVDVAIYYEFLCPGCRSLIAGQLTTAFQKVGEIMALDMVPYGNAETYKNSSASGGYTFKCQHGPIECLGNMVETCALHFYKNTSVTFPFISCMEGTTSSIPASLKRCAEVHHLDADKINGCVNSPLGVELEYEMAKKTDALQPPHEYTPWVTINGKHTDEIQQKAETDFTGLVCSVYTGSPKPQACDKTNKVGKSFRN